MNTPTATERYVGITLTVVLMLFAVWLVSPFISIDRSDYAQKGILGYRLALGLLIMIIFVGKWAFDSLAPQGLARKVSNVKAVALILLSLFIMGFIVFIIAQATVLFLKTSAQEEQQQQQTIINN
jgi:NADH:ubiquinone oxidoreductase subunit 6 (subunit J)